MSIATEKTHVMLEELLASEDAGRFEIVDGQLEEVHVSNQSAKVSTNVVRLLDSFCKNHGVGEAFDANAYYQCFRDAVEHACFLGEAVSPSVYSRTQFSNSVRTAFHSLHLTISKQSLMVRGTF